MLYHEYDDIINKINNIALRTLICVPIVKYEMLRLAANYGPRDVREGLSTIMGTVSWSFFV